MKSGMAGNLNTIGAGSEDTQAQGKSGPRSGRSRLREAVVSLSWSEFKALGFEEVVPHFRSAGIREVEVIEDTGRHFLLQLEVESPLEDLFHLDPDCVVQWDYITETEEDGYRYLLELTAMALPPSITDHYEQLIGTCDLSFDNDCVTMSLVGQQSTIKSVLDNFKSIGVIPDICRLGDYMGEGSLSATLTDRQFEVLTTAYNMGYYDVPRQATTSVIAEELEIDPGTVAELLQRAERNILRRELTPDQGTAAEVDACCHID